MPEEFNANIRVRLKGDPTRNGVGTALWKQRRAVKPEQALLDQPTHEVAAVRRVGGAPFAAFEPVAIKQGHEQLEIFILAVVRRGSHQKEVACRSREHLAEPVTFGVLADILWAASTTTRSHGVTRMRS